MHDSKSVAKNSSGMRSVTDRSKSSCQFYNKSCSAVCLSRVVQGGESECQYLDLLL
jgi:hypothetical protein